MMKSTGLPIVCRSCGKENPSEEYFGNRQRPLLDCKKCRAERDRARYHNNPRARAMQVACSSAENVKKNFPEAATGLLNIDYVNHLLAATHCHYCEMPNDGSHPFNLDHRVALGNGGRHELSNLVPCCEPCNRAKRDMPADVFMAWLDGVAQRRTLRLNRSA